VEIFFKIWYCEAGRGQVCKSTIVLQTLSLLQRSGDDYVYLQDFNSGRSRGIAHVRMGSREAVEKILSQRNHMIEGYEVRHCAHILNL